MAGFLPGADQTVLSRQRIHNAGAGPADATTEDSHS